MDTYGDLVTLLLTFFVMLYSMSTLDARKWEIFVRSISSGNAVQMQEDVSINAPLGEAEQLMEGSMEIPEIEEEVDAETLYLTLLEKLNETGITGISVSRGEDYTFIVFQDSPFFAGESSVLTDQGKGVLDVLCQVLDGAQEVVGQINIMGHTSQAVPDKPNRTRTDRMLSAMRAAEVCIYIQEKEIIEPEKLVCLSYGQHRPVAPFDTASNRALNRRVELLLLDNGADLEEMNEHYSDYAKMLELEQPYIEENQADGVTDGFGNAEPNRDNVSSRLSPITMLEEEEAFVETDAAAADENSAARNSAAENAASVRADSPASSTGETGTASAEAAATGAADASAPAAEAAAPVTDGAASPPAETAAPSADATVPASAEASGSMAEGRSPVQTVGLSGSAAGNAAE